MAGRKLIEFVCTGNSGRSPVAERVARNYLIKIGADIDYQVVSSGTLVDAMAKGGFSIEAMTPFIKRARGRGDIYGDEQLKALDAALRLEDATVVEGFFNQAITKFVDEEHADRAVVVPELGIVGEIKTTPEQTVIRPDVIAVLAMDRGNADKVKRIYEGGGYLEGSFVGGHPVMSNLSTRHSLITTTLSAYATGDLDSEIPNAFGIGRAGYRETVEGIVKYVPQAVDRIVVA